MLLSRLQQLLAIDASLFELEDRLFQIQLAKHLRAKAIQHLRDSQGVVAKSFRGEYVASGLGDYRVFLAKQERDGAWGTYLEAAALGECLNMHVIAYSNSGGSEQPICLYRATELNAPTIQLHNQGNQHWYHDRHTLADGNCLYNSIAQSLKTMVKQEQYNKHYLTGNFLQGLNGVNKRAVDSQRQAIVNHPTPADLQADLEQEAKRIQALPTTEQQQIIADYKLALKLARSEMRKISHITSQTDETSQAQRATL